MRSLHKAMAKRMLAFSMIVLQSLIVLLLSLPQQNMSCDGLNDGVILSNNHRKCSSAERLNVGLGRILESKQGPLPCHISPRLSVLGI
jgi:hypothetical protein